MSIASVVLPVPTSPVNQMPRPASKRSGSARTYWRTSRTTWGFARSIDSRGTGARAGAPRRTGTRSRHTGRLGRRRSIPIVPDVRHEPRVVLLEGQLHGPQPAVAVLGDDQVGDALALGLVVVVVLAVDE